MALSCRYVDEVVIGAPYVITADMMTALNIGTVVHVNTEDEKVLEQYADIDPYEVPKA
jgi:ethanolamine-phosphate cytidylyltransferase